MVKLQYSKPALIDLQHVFLYISNDSVRNAKRFVQALKDRIKILKKKCGHGTNNIVKSNKEDQGYKF